MVSFLNQKIQPTPKYGGSQKEGGATKNFKFNCHCLEFERKHFVADSQIHGQIIYLNFNLKQKTMSKFKNQSESKKQKSKFSFPNPNLKI